MCLESETSKSLSFEQDGEKVIKFVRAIIVAQDECRVIINTR